jgi:arylsulfatase A-like enzyme
MMSSSRRKNLSLALGLGVLLMLLSYARIVGDSQSMQFREEVTETIFANSMMGTRLMWNVIVFGVALTLLHLTFGAVSWALGTISASISRQPDHQKNERQHVILWFALLTIALLAYNSAEFSRSSLGSAYARILTSPIGGVPLGKCIAGLIVLAALGTLIAALVKSLRAGWRPYRDARRFTVGASALALTFVLGGWAAGNHSHNDSARMNVVLIGVDSLRLDIVEQQDAASVAPHLREFLDGSAWFTDTMTPLARTFPSVTSILTGRQPHKTGAYMNLPPRDFIREGDTLGRVFGRAGYHTIFGMDEARFANFDTSYGFDQAVTPPPGATEFLLSLFADTPLSNAVLNTRLGGWLFPYVHANRGAAATYDPDAFVRRLGREVNYRNPLLFATHLTLSHWPYNWSGSPLPGPKTDAVWPDYYVNVIGRVDQQFADIMSILRDKGVLENAIVVLYSDHGESFGKHDESLVPDDDPLIKALAARPQWGHGSTVLTAHQYKVVLGMRAFGKAEGTIPRSRRIAAPVSVMDIAPTLVQLAGVQTDTPYDGQSLVPLMNQDDTPAQFVHRVRFTETEFTPVGVASPSGKVSASGIAQVAKLYAIDPVTDRVTVRPENLEPMLSIRQYAAVGDEWMLVALPFRSEGLSHQFVVLPKSGGQPQLLSSAPTPDAPEDLRRVWDAMQTNFHGLVPTGETLEKVVANSTVSGGGRPVTQDVNK